MSREEAEGLAQALGSPLPPPGPGVRAHRREGTLCPHGGPRSPPGRARCLASPHVTRAHTHMHTTRTHIPHMHIPHAHTHITHTHMHTTRTHTPHMHITHAHTHITHITHAYLAEL